MGTILSHTTVSAAQKAALARVLASRYRRLCAGELYVVDGFPLTQPSEAVMIDIGLVLIGLFECLRDHREAEKVLRDIAVLFLRSSMREPDAAQSRIIPDKLDIRHGSEMLEIWMQHSEASRIAAVLRFAGRLLLRQQTTPNWDDDQTTMQIATALLPDAWELYSKTLNLFGRGMLMRPCCIPHEGALDSPTLRPALTIKGRPRQVIELGKTGGPCHPPGSRK